MKIKVNVYKLKTDEGTNHWIIPALTDHRFPQDQFEDGVFAPELAFRSCVIDAAREKTSCAVSSYGSVLAIVEEISEGEFVKYPNVFQKITYTLEVTP